MISNLLKLSSKVRIRKEHFGGILFNMDTGDVIELDREAFMVISFIKEIEIVDMKNLLDSPIFYQGVNIDRQRTRDILSRLTAIGVIKKKAA